MRALAKQAVEDSQAGGHLSIEPEANLNGPTLEAKEHRQESCSSLSFGVSQNVQSLCRVIPRVRLRLQTRLRPNR